MGSNALFDSERASLNPVARTKRPGQYSGRSGDPRRGRFRRPLQ